MISLQKAQIFLLMPTDTDKIIRFTSSKLSSEINGIDKPKHITYGDFVTFQNLLPKLFKRYSDIKIK